MSEREPVQFIYVERSMILGEYGKVLFVQRASDDSHDPEHWELPGGKVDVGEDLEAARYREIKEETGLDTIQILPEFEIIEESEGYHHSGEYRRYRSRTTLAKQIAGVLKLSEEHKDATCKLPKDALIELQLTEACRHVLLQFLGLVDKEEAI